MKQNPENLVRARLGAFALLCATEGQVDQEFLGLAVRSLITNLGHYCDFSNEPFRRINRGAMRDWEKQRLKNDK